MSGHVGEELDQREDLLAHDRVALHHRALLGVERPRLVEDRLGHGQLADVVQRRGEAEVAHAVPLHAARRQAACAARSTIERAWSAV